MYTPITPISAIMYTMIDKIGFSNWLDQEIKRRELSRAKFADKVGVTRQAITNIIARQSMPSFDTLKSMARVLGYQDVVLFRKIGILDPIPEKTAQTEELVFLFDRLPDDEKRNLIDYMRIKLIQLENAGRIKT